MSTVSMINSRMIVLASIIFYSVHFTFTISQDIQHCNETADTVNQNRDDWGAIRSFHPQPGTQKVFTKENEQGMAKLFSILYNSEQIELIIMIENSYQLGLSNYYLRQRKLVEDLLKHHLSGNSRQLSVALFTFARHLRIHSGLNHARMSIQDLLAEGSWQRDFDSEINGPINITNAFINAKREISSEARDTERVVLTFSTGSYDVADIPTSLIRELNSSGVQLFSVHSALMGGNTCPQQVTDLASLPNQCVTSKQWMDRLWNLANDTGSSCDNPDVDCGPGWCYAPGHASSLCWCPWGYTNDRCQDEENECTFPVCGGHGTCQDGDATFDCRCQRKYCGCYCRDACDDGLADWELILIGVLAGAIVVILAVILHKLWSRNRPSRCREGSDQHPPDTPQGPVGADGVEGESDRTYTNLDQSSRSNYLDMELRIHPKPPLPPRINWPMPFSSSNPRSPAPPPFLPTQPPVVPEEDRRHIIDALMTQQLEPWKEYITDVLQHEVLESVFISNTTMPQYLASRDFKLTQEEQNDLISHLDVFVNNLYFTFRNKPFSIKSRSESGLDLYVALGSGEPSVLCVGRNEQYLVVALRPNTSRESQRTCQVIVEQMLGKLHY